jgi:antirestriction protein
MVLDAQATADGVRDEGMELVSNLREMSDALRSNAERLLHDIQTIHSRMLGELERVDPEGVATRLLSESEPADEASQAPAGEEQLDVPDSIPCG